MTDISPDALMPLNPFRPGAGQKPIYLAGRTKEQDQFRRVLRQVPVSQNVIVTGLRGVGKTVLLDDLKPIAQSAGWLWTGNDLSESASLTEERIATRIVVDLSTLLAPVPLPPSVTAAVGFTGKSEIQKRTIQFKDLWDLYQQTPGLHYDKLKETLIQVASIIKNYNIPGIVFAYDEAQNLADHAANNEYPLSLLLDVFSFLQRTHVDCKYLLVLSGLPTLFPKLNEARTYTERMFHVMHLERLSDEDAKQAILKPIEITKSSLKFNEEVTSEIVHMSGGYPYFIQFICKEVFDAWIGRVRDGEAPLVPRYEILAKLDQDFFAPRWARATDRQQEFMRVIATLEKSDDEFTVQEIVNKSKITLEKGFTPSHATQILQSLAEKGLIYKKNRGSYRFAVPLLATYILRQSDTAF